MRAPGRCGRGLLLLHVHGQRRLSVNVGRGGCSWKFPASGSSSGTDCYGAEALQRGGHFRGIQFVVSSERTRAAIAASAVAQPSSQFFLVGGLFVGCESRTHGPGRWSAPHAVRVGLNLSLRPLLLSGDAARNLRESLGCLPGAFLLCAKRDRQLGRWKSSTELGGGDVAQAPATIARPKNRARLLLRFLPLSH